MITKEEMIQIAEKYLIFMDAEDGIETILLDEQTIEKPYGSIFYYTSKLYKETGDFEYFWKGSNNHFARILN